MLDLMLAGGRRMGSGRTRVMAILNATPDSFSDGGRLSAPGALEARIRQAVAEGADILDVGGESTRPGHAPVDADEEWRRVEPVLAAIRREAPGVPVSIDTRKAAVAARALDAGAAFVNDVSGLADPAMADVVREAGCAVVLMRSEPLRGDVVAACAAQLAQLVARARSSGLHDSQLILDPGLGFADPPGGDVDANLALVRGVRDYAAGFPVLVGASRKRFIGAMAGEAVPERRGAQSARVARMAAEAGAAIVRVHDVAATVQALRGSADGQ